MHLYNVYDRCVYAGTNKYSKITNTSSAGLSFVERLCK